MKGDTTIKKKIIYFAVLTTLLVMVLFLPKYSQIVFVIKHTVIFLFAASVVVLIVKSIYNGFLKQYSNVLVKRKLMIFNAFTIITIGGLLFGVRVLQTNFIALTETPPIVFCYYYDDYGNYIHGSRMSYVCPELEILINEDNLLKFKAEYRFINDEGTTNVTKDNDGPWYQSDDGFAVVDIEITYNDDHFITSYIAQTSMNYQLKEYYGDSDDFEDNNSIMKYYSSFYFTIETEYSDTVISQKKQGFYIKQEDSTYDDITVLNHYDFVDVEPDFNYELILEVLEETETTKHFEIYDPSQGDTFRFRGDISKLDNQIDVFFEYNPDIVNPEPNVISDSYQIKQDEILRTHTSGSSYTNYEYTFHEGFGYIQSFYQHYNGYILNGARDSNTFIRDDFIIVEGVHQTHKIYNTNYGFMIEEYHGDNEKSENPPSDKYYLVSRYTGLDERVFQYNPIALVYQNQPISQFNPMISYLYKDYFE